jgi:hypothetical protein
VIPFAAGGETSAKNLELRRRKHNQYEADRYFGPLQVPLVREARAVYGVMAKSSRDELALEGVRVKGRGSSTPADAISCKPRSTARRSRACNAASC